MSKLEFSEQERERAFEQIDEALDCNEVATYKHHGYNPRIIDLQCRLNRAEELLRLAILASTKTQYRERCDTIRDFLTALREERGEQ